MRKDVKIGLGIGGVLLAVLIVYVLVPKNNDDRLAREVDVITVDGGQEAGGGAGAGTDATAAGSSAGATGGSQEAATNTGGAAPAGPESDAAARQQADAGGAESNTGQAGGEPARGNDVASGSGPTFDWNAILTTGVVPPEARIGMVAPTSSANDDPFGDAQKPDNAGANDSIVWPRGTSGDSTAGNTAGQQPTTPAAPGGAQPAQPAAPRTAVTSHVVQPGETYSSIAQVVYGDARYYSELKNANPTIDERRLKPGTTIKIPDRATFKPRGTQQGGAITAGATAAAALPQIDPAREYRVGPGESLYKIAVKLYGKGDKADALYELNKDKIGDDPARVKVGMVLKLPQPPASVSSTR